jgi:hypothetical protein
MNEAVYRLHRWLEDDRDRRELRIRDDTMEIWWVGLFIDKRCVSAASGNEFVEVIGEALEGMVLLEHGGVLVE